MSALIMQKVVIRPPERSRNDPAWIGPEAAAFTTAETRLPRPGWSYCGVNTSTVADEALEGSQQ